VRTLLLVLLLGAAGCAGCKSDSKAPTPRAGAGGGGGDTTPARPGRPFDRAAFETISKLDLGAPAEVLELTDDSLAVRIRPAVSPETAATIRLSRCLNCVPMDRAQWEPQLPALKQLLPKEVRDKPDTIFELGEVTVANRKAIFTHQVAVLAEGGTDGKPLTRAMNTHAYTLYWNDGTNQLQITAKDASQPDSATVDILAAKVPRTTLETLATSTFTLLAPHL
jgi:hypothetical protein